MREKRQIYHGIIWATFGVAWLMFNPFFGLGSQTAPQPDEVYELPAPKEIRTETPPPETIIPTLPSQIEIPKISINTQVQHVGKDKRGNVGIPDNFTDTAWYNLGPLPGAPGAALIVGHVNDRFAAPAVFANLHKLEPGDDITVTDQTGNKFHFTVEEKQNYHYRNFPPEKIFGPYSEPRLHLITCTGRWLSAERSYDQRLIVFAKLVEAGN